jgi:hypothetical protein
VAADAFGVVEPALSLHGTPDALGIARSRAGRNRGYDVGVDGVREVDDTFPFRARKDTVEACRGRLERRIVIVLEVSGVAPGTADAHVGRTKRGGEVAKFGIGEVDRWTVLEPVGIEVYRLIAVWGGRAFLLEGLIGRPEAATGNLDRFNVIGHVAGIDLAENRHGLRRNDRLREYGASAGGRQGGCECNPRAELEHRFQDHPFVI